MGFFGFVFLCNEFILHLGSGEYCDHIEYLFSMYGASLFGMIFKMVCKVVYKKLTCKRAGCGRSSANGDINVDGEGECQCGSWTSVTEGG